ncbi:hypothetical protein DFJ74DRAFT_402090 [Hyaloraphidium curvatum]|nr:hypothetical protein DFJ74DRAFT_402090 [Hyaloraphidium curvatum]
MRDAVVTACLLVVGVRIVSGTSQAFGTAYWTRSGNATFQSGDLQLTPSDHSQEGAGYFNSPISSSLLSSFSVTFSFTLDEPIQTFPQGAPIDNYNYSGADGVGFIIRSSAPAQLPDGRPDSWSNNVGVEDDLAEPPNNFIAVFTNRKFMWPGDVKCDVQLPTPYALRDFRKWTVTFLYPGGGAPAFVNASNVVPPGQSDAGALAGTSQMTVNFTCPNLDIPGLFRSAPQVYVGFTAQTGWRANRQRMQSFAMLHCGGSNATLSSSATCTCLDGFVYDGTSCVPSNGSTSSGGLSVGAIVGIVIGVLALLVALGLLAWYFTRKRNQPAATAAAETPKDVSFAEPQMTAKGDSATFAFAGKEPPPYVPPAELSFNDPGAAASPLANYTLQPSGPDSPTAAGYPGYTIAMDSIAGGALAGAAGVAGAAAAGTVAANSASASTASRGATGKYVCIRTFVPTNEDEIVLSESNLVMVEEVYADGWATGTNLTTKVRGVFPLAALAKLEPQA